MKHMYGGSLEDDDGTGASIRRPMPANMSGGKRYRKKTMRRSHRKYKGGMLQQALVPLTLLGASMFYGKKKTRKHGKRSHKFSRKH